MLSTEYILERMLRDPAVLACVAIQVIIAVFWLLSTCYTFYRNSRGDDPRVRPGEYRIDCTCLPGRRPAKRVPSRISHYFAQASPSQFPLAPTLISPEVPAPPMEVVTEPIFVVSTAAEIHQPPMHF
ncbi:uncharacterized protein LOC129587935 [Paramacrobiotus metropolitanus]|uniref:uncharacterized protein LOC129587935 n=1 Tax=Paramacrobiotus metropolitanus TaxID=2943436 RepID=UPI00244614E3|nr:uncharacterized protein LOC129587935 [Paramacrobiotus metropolitanus]